MRFADPLPSPDSSGGGGSLPTARPTDIALEGAGQHAGYSIAKACVIRLETLPVPERRISDSEISAEVARLLAAAGAVEGDFKRMVDSSPHLGTAQTAMADSLRYVRPNNSVMEDAQKLIQQDKYGAEFAVQQAFDAVFNAVDDEFVRDRAYEILDVKSRLLKILYPAGSDVSAQLKQLLDSTPGPKIVITENLSPAQALQLYQREVKGLVIKNTSHFGHQDLILSDLDCPVVGNLDLITNRPIETGDEIIVDGDHGFVTIRPTGSTRAQAFARMELLDAPEGKVPLSAHAPRSKDGLPIQFLGDVKDFGKFNEFSVRRVCAVGLVRTEFGPMKDNRFHTEAEQVAQYRAILQAASPAAVSLRTYDFGFDKIPEFLRDSEAATSGLRGIRLALECLSRDFEDQLRSMVLAAHEVGNELRIIFPMVLDAGDMRRARSVYDRVVSGLLADARIPRAPQNIRLGAMIETSSAVELIEPILRRSDFVSLGSNDLLISTLDGDQNKASGAHYHPAFLSCARKVAHAARAAGKELFICGEMPCHTRNIPLLIGIGATNFVLSWNSIEAVNAKLSNCDSAECAELVQRIIDCGDGDEAYNIHLAFLEELRSRGEKGAQ